MKTALTKRLEKILCVKLLKTVEQCRKDDVESSYVDKTLEDLFRVWIKTDFKTLKEDIESLFLSFKGENASSKVIDLFCSLSVSIIEVNLDDAVKFLIKWGKVPRKYFPFLYDLVENHDSLEIRTHAIKIIGLIEGNKKYIWRKLLKLLLPKNEFRIREAAVVSLRLLKSKNEEIIASLLNVLESDVSHYVRKEAAVTLGILAKNYDFIVMELFRLLENEKNYECVLEILYALEKMGKLPESKLHILLRLSKKPSDFSYEKSKIAWLARRVLINQKELPQDILNELVIIAAKSFENDFEFDSIRWWIEESSTDQILIGIADYLKTGNNEDLLYEISRCIGGAERRREYISNCLLFLLENNKNRIIRSHAVESLGHLDYSSKQIRSSLVNHLKNDTMIGVRIKCVHALGKLSKRDGKVAALLSYFLIKDDDECIRTACAQSLESIGVSSDLIRMRLIHALDDIDKYVQIFSAEALSNLFKKDRRILRIILSKSKNVSNRISDDNIAECIGNIGLADNQGFYKLKEILRNGDIEEQGRAAEALIKLGSKEEQHIDILARAIDDDYWTGPRKSYILTCEKHDLTSPIILESLIQSVTPKDQDYGKMVVPNAALFALTSLGRKYPFVREYFAKALGKKLNDETKLRLLLVTKQISIPDSNLINASLSCLDDWELREEAFSALKIMFYSEKKKSMTKTVQKDEGFSEYREAMDGYPKIKKDLHIYSGNYRVFLNSLNNVKKSSVLRLDIKKDKVEIKVDSKELLPEKLCNSLQQAVSEEIEMDNTASYLNIAQGCAELIKENPQRLAIMSCLATDPSNIVRGIAASVIPYLKEPSKKEIKILRNLLKDVNENVLLVACNSIGQMARKYAEVEKLINNLSDSEYFIFRSIASRCFSVPARKSAEAWRRLHSLATDSNEDVRWCATWALAELSDSRSKAWKLLLKRLDEDSYGNQDTVQCLYPASICDPDKWSLIKWITLYHGEDKDKDLFSNSEQSGSPFLSKIKNKENTNYSRSQSVNVSKAISEYFDLESEVISRFFGIKGSWVVGKLASYYDEAMELTQVLAKSSNEHFQTGIALSIGELARKRDDVWKILVRLSRNKNITVRWAAAQSIACSIDRRPEALKILRRMAGSKEPGVRLGVALSLRSFRIIDQNAIDILENLARNSDDEDSRGIIAALSQIVRYDSEAALNLLRNCAKPFDRSNNYRSNCGLVLRPLDDALCALADAYPEDVLIIMKEFQRLGIGAESYYHIWKFSREKAVSSIAEAFYLLSSSETLRDGINEQILGLFSEFENLSYGKEVNKIYQIINNLFKVQTLKEAISLNIFMNRNLEKDKKLYPELSSFIKRVQRWLNRIKLGNVKKEELLFEWMSLESIIGREIFSPHSEVFSDLLSSIKYRFVQINQ